MLPEPVAEIVAFMERLAAAEHSLIVTLFVLGGDNADTSARH